MNQEPSLAEMNLLTWAGIISDNAITWADVAECDKVRALEFLAAGGVS